MAGTGAGLFVREVGFNDGRKLGDSARFTYQHREYVAWQNVAFRARTATP